jgi:hypothetical protein
LGATLLLAVTMIGAGPTRAADLDDFGRCLKREGAKFYGTSWCPHCRAQRETLGDAMKHVPYVECSIDGKRGETTAACRRAKVESFPTWTFGDGSQESGAQSLEELAAKTGCEPPRARRRSRAGDDPSDDE